MVTLVISCPVCKDPMKEVPFKKLMIDVCTRCKGVWLDPGELELALNAHEGKAK